MDVRGTIASCAEALRSFPGQALPSATPDLLARAEKIAAGTVFFYGRTEVEIGLRNIDWTGSHVNHQEWPAQLNRFYHLPPLAAAYRETGDERFAEVARSYIEDWIRAHPGYETAQRFTPGDSGLNMSARLGTSHTSGWGGSLPTFLSSPAFDDTFLQTLLDSVSVQAVFLADHLTPWGNWRIAELDALVFTALRFPFLKGAPGLLARGIKGMRNALATQFLSDGLHIERTPGYHEWMAGVLASYYELARRFPEADAKVDCDTIVRAFDYAAHDELFGVNDSRAPHRDPKALRHPKQRKDVLGKLFPTKGLPADAPLEQVFPQAGHVFVRSGWEPGADHLAFDAGTWGGGHCHLSRLSFVFRSGGRELVADPGILNYEMSDPLGPYGKSTRAHSTLNLNGWNQCEADADLLRAEFTADTALVHAKYSGGYWEGEYGWSFAEGRGRGLFGIHERVLFWVKGEYLLALDAMEADSGATVHNCWQTGPMDSWKADRDALSWWSRNSDVNLLLKCVPFVENTEMDCFEGSRDPIRGWVGLHGNDAFPAPLVEFRFPAGLSGSSPSAVLIAPFSGDTPPVYAVKRTSRTGWGHLRYVELALPNGDRDLITWTKDLSSPAECGSPIVSDAPFVWLRVDAGGRPAKCFMLDGSYLEWEGRQLHDADRREAALLTLD
jgi:hypothetical protein